jgi:CHAT domain-containing protein/Tfp pilus assembly protein PilF
MHKKFFLFFAKSAIVFILGISLNCTRPIDERTNTDREYLHALNSLNTGKYDEAIVSFKDLIDKDCSFASAYKYLVDAFLKKRMLPDAELYFKSLATDASYEPYCLWALGLLYSEGDFDSAARHFKKVIEKKIDFDEPCIAIVDLYCKYKKKISDIEDLFNTLLKSNPYVGSLYIGLGYLYQMSNEPEKGLAMYNKAISRFSYNLDGYFYKADILKNRNSYAAAIKTLEESLKKVPSIKDINKKGEIFESIGVLYGYTGNNRKSVEYFNKAFSIIQTVGNVKNILEILYNSGNVALNSRHINKADENNKEALLICQDINDKDEEARIAYSWALLYKNHGFNARALDNYKIALAIFRGKGNKREEQRVLIGMSESYLGFQDYSNALDSVKQALFVAEDAKDGQGIAVAYGVLAKPLAELGDYDQAIEYLNNTLRYFSGSGNKKMESIVLWNIGLIHSQGLNDYSAALQFFDKALSIIKPVSTTINENDNLCGIYNNIGYTNLLAGNYQQARKDLFEAHEIVVKTGNKLREAFIMNNRALLDLKLMKYEEAYDFFQETRALGERLKNPEIVQTALLGIGDIYHKRGDYNKANNCYRKVIDMIESMRNSLKTEEYKIGYFQGLISAYEKMIRLQYDSNRKYPGENHDRLSFSYAEKSKARAFLDMLEESKINIGRASSSESDLTEIRNALIDSDSLLVEYKITDEGLFAWAITKDDIKILKIDVAKNTLQKDIKTLRTYITAKSEPVEFAQKAFNLYSLLLGQIMGEIKNKTKLLIAPDGILYYLPFDVLIDENPGNNYNDEHYRNLSFLIKKYTIRYCPSLSVAAAIRQHKTEKRVTFEKDLFALGDPVYSDKGAWDNNIYVRSAFSEPDRKSLSRLVHSGDEVLNIAKLFKKTDVFLNEQATKEQMIFPGRLEQYRFIHIAAHGLLNENKPRLSGIVLAGNASQADFNVLRMDEIFHLKVNADLVVLSACNTGLGRIVSGEGVVGLTRAWFYAGASSVMASLWPVDDKSTAYLMEEFYRNIKRNMNFSDALRNAKLLLIDTANNNPGQDKTEPEYDYPYYWAGFVLSGTDK